MNRRHVLALIGAGATLGLAGCLGDAETPGNDDGATGSTPESPQSPGAPDEPCPPYETSRDRAVCSHTVETESTAVSLEPRPDQRALDDGVPAEELSLTLHNRSASELTFNPHSWRIRHRSESGWRELDRQRSGDGRLVLSPGDSHSWSFTGAVESIQADPELQPGLYAAEIGVPDPETGSGWVACIALVRLGVE